MHDFWTIIYYQQIFRVAIQNALHLLNKKSLWICHMKGPRRQILTSSKCQTLEKFFKYEYKP